MSWPLIRQLLRRIALRCATIESVLAQAIDNQKDSTVRTFETAEFELFARCNTLNRHDCAAALRRVDIALREPTTAECVRRQLLDAVELRVNRVAMAHPWGSTTVVEHLVEPQFARDVVTIDVETDELPHSINTEWLCDDRSLPLTFQLERIRRMRSQQVGAVYRVTAG